GLALAAGKAKELVHVVLCPPHPVHHPPLVVVVVDTEQGVGTPGLPFLCAVTLGHGAAGQAPAVTGGAAIVADDIELVNPGGGVWTLVVEGQEGAVELILVGNGLEQGDVLEYEVVGVVMDDGLGAAGEEGVDPV